LKETERACASRFGCIGRRRRLFFSNNLTR
jgi:hypothetical protein